MKRSLIFLLILLVVAGGLLYAADTVIRSQIEATLQQAQAEKQLSISSWEYDSLSRRLVLHDVKADFSSTGTGVPYLAREIRGDINLRALLHSIPQLDFLLPAQGYLTMLDAWQGTNVSHDSSSPDAGDCRLSVARMEGEGLAIPVAQFKKLRDGTETPDKALRQGVTRSLVLENVAFTFRQPHQPTYEMTLGKGRLEKWDMQGGIGSIYLEKCALRQEDSLALQLGTLTMTDLVPQAMEKLGSLKDMAQVWDTFIEDIPFTSLAVTDAEMRQPTDTFVLGGLDIVRAEGPRRLKQLAFRKMRLEGNGGEGSASIRLVDYAMRDLVLPDSALAKEFLLAVEDPRLFEAFLANHAPDKPFFSHMLLKDADCGLGGISVSLELLDTTWALEGDTQTLVSTIRNFLIPGSMLQAMPLPFALPGLKEIRLSMSSTQTLTNGESRHSGKIVADSLCELAYQHEAQGKSVLGPWTTLRHLDSRLTDKGLMAIIALNIAPDPAVAQMGMETLAQVVAENLPNGREALPALRTFIATPGELRLSITGDDWIPIQGDDPLWLLQLAPRLRLDATPGKNSLADLVAAQQAKAGN